MPHPMMDAPVSRLVDLLFFFNKKNKFDKPRLSGGNSKEFSHAQTRLSVEKF
jgi:hypothetical protein